jgi:chlorobactene glucosyltransferase
MTMEYQVGVLVILFVMAAVVMVNLASLRSLHAAGKPGHSPTVSVLIPARNETGNIGRCLEGLVGQEYPDYEILVLDDNSSDTTAEIVTEWERRDPRIRYLRGAPLAPGWVGKNFACHQLAKAAGGALLLFTDADTVHGPASIAAGVAAMEDMKADLLTAIPRQLMVTFWEKTVLPLLHFSTFSFLPLPFVDRLRDPRFAMANGQYMMFRRDVYDGIGGHRAVREAIVEDVWLSRLVKEKGFRLRIVDGGDTVACRMYSSLAELWRGFSKNLFAGFRFSLPAISLVMLFNAVTSVLPFLFFAGIPFGAVPAAVIPVVSAQVLVVLGIRVAFSIRFRMNVPAVLLHPAAMVMVIGIAVNSIRWILFAGGSKWRGREYRFHKESLTAIRSAS